VNDESQGEVMVHRGLAEIHLLDKQVSLPRIWRYMYFPYSRSHLISFDAHALQKINSLDKQAKLLPGSARRERRKGVFVFTSL
jgi:hypothetical protein